MTRKRRRAHRVAKRLGKLLSAHMPSRLVSCSWSQMLLLTIVLLTILKFPGAHGFDFTQVARCSSVKAAWAPCACWTFGPANSASSKLAYSRTWQSWSNVSSNRAGQRIRPLASEAVAHSIVGRGRTQGDRDCCVAMCARSPGQKWVIFDGFGMSAHSPLIP